MKRLFKYLSIPVLISLALIAVPLICTTFLTVYFIQHETYFTNFSTLAWLSFSLLGIFTQAFAITPPTFAALVLGFFWHWKTLPVLFLINLCSIFIIYVLVKWLDNKKLGGFIERYPKAKELIGKIKKDELKIITLTKLSPVMPFTITNIIFVLSGAKLKNILLGGFLGMIPRTILSVWAGTQAKEIKRLLEDPNSENIQQIFLIAFILVSIIGLFWVIGKALNQAKSKL